MRELIDLLQLNNIDFRENDSVLSRSSFKVGGVARLAIFPDSRDKLITTLSALKLQGVKFEVVGNASNVLFAFDFYDGAIVFTSALSEVELFEGEVRASCGASLTHLAQLAAKKSLSGLEFAYGIPALVGGAVYMNAGAYGSCVSNVIKSSLAYDCDTGEVLEITDHHFGYRESIYMENPNLICLEAIFSLSDAPEEKIREKMQENMRSRKEKQPLEYPSAGSYFKRPKDSFAGKLIEDCGLKGLRVGDAEVSEKHAGFIINRGNATAKDILELEEKIKERVMSRFGIMLEREVRLIK